MVEEPIGETSYTKISPLLRISKRNSKREGRRKIRSLFLLWMIQKNLKGKILFPASSLTAEISKSICITTLRLGYKNLSSIPAL